MAKPPKRPRDFSQAAKLVIDVATGQVTDTDQPASPATEFARRGGLKGGKARAAKLTAAQRRAIAKAGAKARWNKGK